MSEWEIADFAARYPGVSINIVSDTLPNLAQAALDGAADVFLATSLQDSNAFECIELGQERFFLCVPPTWPVCSMLPAPNAEGFASLKADEFKLLDGCAFIVMHEDQQIGRKLEELLKAYEVVPGQVVRAAREFLRILCDNGLDAIGSAAHDDLSQ